MLYDQKELILLHNGSLKPVSELLVSDILLGENGEPRQILKINTINNLGKIYKCVTVTEQMFYLSLNSFLCLKRTNMGKDNKYNPKFIKINVNDYLNKNKTFKHCYKIYSKRGDFNHQNVLIDPYFLGVLLGDGSFATQINVTSADNIIIDYTYKLIQIYDGAVSRVAEQENNKSKTYYLSSKFLRNSIKSLGLLRTTSGNKFIPAIYKNNDFNVQAAILAGLIDTDGHKSNNCFDYISKSQQLSADVSFIARSLGLRAKMTKCWKQAQTGGGNWYWRVSISGNTDIVPVKLERKKCTQRQQIKSTNMFGFRIEESFSNDIFYEIIASDTYLNSEFLTVY